MFRKLIAQIIKLRAAHISFGRYRYFLDERRVYGKNLFNHITLPDIIYYFQPFRHLCKNSMFPVKVGSIGTAVADKELGATCVTASMRH